MFYLKNPNLKFMILCRNRVTRKSGSPFGFEIMFKCMSGFTTNNGKFIMPLQEKFSYKNSIDYCDSFGFKNHPDDPTGEKLQIKLIESLKKTWTTDPSCTRRK